MSLEVLELTPPGSGGVSVVKASGAQAFEHVRELAPRLRADVSAPQVMRLRLGDEALDEALVCVLSPAEIELHVHGSPPLVKRIVEFLRARAGECPGSGREDLERSLDRPEKSVEERASEMLPRSVSDSGARILLDQADGALRNALNALSASGPNERATAIQEMLERGRIARFALEPVEVVLAGAVNAGKSTLFNLLLGEDRVIVSEEAGTTRDVVRERAQLGAYPILLNDTAGQREPRGASDLLERASQMQALRARRRAELVLWLSRADSDEPFPVDPRPRSLFRGKPERQGVRGLGPGPMTDRSRDDSPASGRLEIVFTQVDRIDVEARARFPGAISAALEPEATRARIREIFLAAFDLPDEPWSAGGAVPFDENLLCGVRALPLDAHAEVWLRSVAALLGAK